MNINESCRIELHNFILVFADIRDLLLADTFSNHKIIDCLSFMERMDHLRFVDMMNSF